MGGREIQLLRNRTAWESMIIDKSRLYTDARRQLIQDHSSEVDISHPFVVISIRINKIIHCFKNETCENETIA